MHAIPTLYLMQQPKLKENCTSLKKGIFIYFFKKVLYLFIYMKYVLYLNIKQPAFKAWYAFDLCFLSFLSSCNFCFVTRERKHSDALGPKVLKHVFLSDTIGIKNITVDFRCIK